MLLMIHHGATMSGLTTYETHGAVLYSHRAGHEHQATGVDLL
jgi:hypothetical protein